MPHDKSVRSRARPFDISAFRVRLPLLSPADRRSSVGDKAKARETILREGMDASAFEAWVRSPRRARAGRRAARGGLVVGAGVAGAAQQALTRRSRPASRDRRSSPPTWRRARATRHVGLPRGRGLHNTVGQRRPRRPGLGGPAPQDAARDRRHRSRTRSPSPAATRSSARSTRKHDGDDHRHRRAAPTRPTRRPPRRRPGPRCPRRRPPPRPARPATRRRAARQARRRHPAAARATAARPHGLGAAAARRSATARA